jgi:hypothetical protein
MTFPGALPEPASRFTTIFYYSTTLLTTLLVCYHYLSLSTSVVVFPIAVVYFYFVHAISHATQIMFNGSVPWALLFWTPFLVPVLIAMVIYNTCTKLVNQ